MAEIGWEGQRLGDEGVNHEEREVRAGCEGAVRVVWGHCARDLGRNCPSRMACSSYRSLIQVYSGLSRFYSRVNQLRIHSLSSPIQSQVSAYSSAEDDVEYSQVPHMG